MPSLCCHVGVWENMAGGGGVKVGDGSRGFGNMQVGNENAPVI